jgi:hypothetical protein
MRIPQIDTLSILIEARNSLYDSLEAMDPWDIIKRRNRAYDLEVFRSLELDTLSIFKQAFNEIVERERERILAEPRSINRTLVELAWRIGDERFIQPLIEVLEHQGQQRRVIEALVRMRVEPFYSDFVRERTLTTEQIMSDERLNFDLEDFVGVLGTQQAFLELSRFLLSNKPYREIVSGRDSFFTPVSNSAFFLIRHNIRNEDLQKIMRVQGGHTDPQVKRYVYDWMQANFGNYEIRRIW